MYVRILSVLVLTSFTSFGCASYPAQARIDTSQQFVSPAPPSQESLFAGDAKTLSDAQIARILEFDYSPPQSARLAILDFGRSFWNGWSADVSAMAEEMHAELVANLRQSSRISSAAFLPSVLVPEKRTVPYLREAAARYQADLILVYRSQCRSFQKFNFIRADQSRAICGVEAVLLDVRSGLVPVAANASRTYEAKKTTQDLDFREVRMRAQLNAVQGSLLEVAADVRQFLDQSR